MSIRSTGSPRCTKTSVPQIFVGGTHVGGFDDMMELEADDKLNGLLAAE